MQVTVTLKYNKYPVKESTYQEVEKNPSVSRKKTNTKTPPHTTNSLINFTRELQRSIATDECCTRFAKHTKSLDLL